MRSILLAAAFLGLSTAASVGSQPTQPAPHQAAVRDFERLKVVGPLDVHFVVSPGPSAVRSSGPAPQLAELLIENQGDTLMIRLRSPADGSSISSSRVKVLVSGNKIVAACASGGAIVDVAGVRGGKFWASTDDTAKISLNNLAADHVVFTTGGSGGITAVGAARDATFALGGSGYINARDLRVQTATLTVYGGLIRANVVKDARSSVGGAAVW